MNSIKFFVLSLFFASTIAFAPREINLNHTSLDVHRLQNLLTLDNDQLTAEVNEYAELLIRELSLFIIENNLEPLPMPDIHEEERWLLVPVIISLTKGSLGGVSSLKRNSDVIVSYDYPNLKLTLPLSFSRLQFRYDYYVKYGWISKDGQVIGTVAESKFRTDLQLDLTTLKMKLAYFDLQKIGDIDIRLEGGIFDWLWQFFVNIMVPIIKPIIKLVLNSYIEPALNAFIEGVNLIVEKILGPPASLPFSNFINFRLTN